MKKALWQLGGLGVGAGMGSGLVMNLDDISYGQLRKHLLHPLFVLSSKKAISLEDISQIKDGAGHVAQEFKPRGLYQ